MQWVILGTGSDDGLVWSNALGWDEITYDVFSDEEKAKYQLPINGVWFNKENCDNSIKIKELLCLKHNMEDVSLACMFHIYKNMNETMKDKLHNIERVYEGMHDDIINYLFELAQKLNIVMVI